MQHSTNKSMYLAIAERVVIIAILGLTTAIPSTAFCDQLSNTQAETDAATIIADMNSVADAYNKYYAQYGKMMLYISDLTAMGYLKEDYNNETYIDNAAGFNNQLDALDAGNGTQWATIVESAIKERATAACKKINEKMLGLAPDAAIPKVTWTDVDGVHKFDAIPAEIKNKKFFCINNGTNYDIIKIIRLKE